MAKVAIVGTGIAGLSSAYHLHRSHDITVYEKEPCAGGHSRTLDIEHSGRPLRVDTGFIVFNRRNYPNLTALFRRLAVPVEKSDMSFAVTVRQGWLEWGAASANAVFGQRRNILRPEFHRLMSDVMRFNANAEAVVDAEPELALGALIERMNLGDWFRWYYLLPMAGAIWSCPPRQMLTFPASSFIRFFANHGLLSVRGQPQWYTVSGGARTYVERLCAPFRDNIRPRCAVVSVRRKNRSVEVCDARGHSETFDHVVFACHADAALSMLADATPTERAALSSFAYQKNRVVLHKSPQFMPRRRRCWASWVYNSDGRQDEAAISVTYWMNRLQSIDARYPLFVTLNPAQTIPDELIFDEHEFSHPVFEHQTLAGQAMLRALQGRNRTWFCGAHLGHGFHEDGLVSGLDVAIALDALGERAHPHAASPRQAAEDIPIEAALD